MLPVATGVVVGLAAHLVAILIMPYQAPADAWARIATLGPTNTVVLVPPAAADNELMPFLDPAFATAACRYDLSGGPLKLRAPVTADYTSVSFYTRNGLAFYGINDRAAGGKVIDVDLMTPQQKAQLPADEDITAADRLIVESPSKTGIAIIRALVREAGARPAIEVLLARATCGPPG
ncbi:MAG: DUF1254 domain-containing protein [Methylacidiphilales bacterium]|nr:DUF1254 domain-containing protein [Candidatus Methylacidiphilales bacterium]